MVFEQSIFLLNVLGFVKNDILLKGDYGEKTVFGGEIVFDDIVLFLEDVFLNPALQHELQNIVVFVGLKYLVFGLPVFGLLELIGVQLAELIAEKGVFLDLAVLELLHESWLEKYSWRCCLKKAKSLTVSLFLVCKLSSVSCCG